jgi:hypothetical protein
LSWAHMIELFGLGHGRTFETIAEYLKSFGRHFILIEADTNKVARREHEWVPGRQIPVIDEEFLRLLVGHWDGKSELSVGILLDAMKDEADFFVRMKESQTDYKTHVKNLFDDYRLRYKTDAQTKKELDDAQFSKLPPLWLADRTQRELIRNTVRTNERFNPSDAIDFSHAVVGLSYCDYVVLDKKWARRCRAIALPNWAAAIFDVTEIDKFLSALENRKPS